MKILVTGGAGFIGSHTCLALLEEGYDLVVIDSYVNSNEKSLERVIDTFKINNKAKKANIEIEQADIRDEIELDKLFSEHQSLEKPIEAVIHFAGLKSVTESVLNPLNYWDVNVNGSITLLRIMKRYKCRTIVFSSSATIYGLASNKPLKENTEIKPINPYGRTKVAIEQLLSDNYFSEPGKWRIANLRYFNPIGAHSSGIIGEDPKGIPNNIFPYILQVAAGNISKLNIFGDDWPTIDGSGVRDYIHIMDLAEGHVAALGKIFNNNPNILNLNLGTGIGTSVLELINVFQEVNKVKIPYEISSRRKGDVATIIADNISAVSYLNWTPKRSLKEMCTDGWKWQLINPKGYI